MLSCSSGEGNNWNNFLVKSVARWCAERNNLKLFPYLFR